MLKTNTQVETVPRFHAACDNFITFLFHFITTLCHVITIPSLFPRHYLVIFVLCHVIMTSRHVFQLLSRYSEVY